MAGSACCWYCVHASGHLAPTTRSRQQPGEPGCTSRFDPIKQSRADKSERPVSPHRRSYSTLTPSHAWSGHEHEVLPPDRPSRSGVRVYQTQIKCPSARSNLAQCSAAVLGRWVHARVHVTAITPKGVDVSDVRPEAAQPPRFELHAALELRTAERRSVTRGLRTETCTVAFVDFVRCGSGPTGCASPPR